MNAVEKIKHLEAQLLKRLKSVKYTALDDSFSISTHALSLFIEKGSHDILIDYKEAVILKKVLEEYIAAIDSVDIKS